MNRALALLVIGLVFGGGIGFVIAAANGVTLDGHDHATDHGETDPHAGHDLSGAGDASHDHAELVEVLGPTPTLMLHVIQDPMVGWNVQLMTTNFTFSPTGASGAHVDGEGHAHIYANGKKLGRVYGDWLHIERLPSGEVTLEATLNSNDHRTLSVDGKAVTASVTLQNVN